jgi:hypothetical protein
MWSNCVPRRQMYSAGSPSHKLLPTYPIFRLESTILSSIVPAWKLAVEMAPPLHTRSCWASMLKERGMTGRTMFAGCAFGYRAFLSFYLTLSDPDPSSSEWHQPRSLPFPLLQNRSSPPCPC